MMLDFSGMVERARALVWRGGAAVPTAPRIAGVPVGDIPSHLLRRVKVERPGTVEAGIAARELEYRAYLAAFHTVRTDGPA